ncbi:MAG: MipA/OmpV family protein [Proteobacteria bacterium]|nr:MipA/OmpV family protein [Pseudomonadota bacterium]
MGPHVTGWIPGRQQCAQWLWCRPGVRLRDPGPALDTRAVDPAALQEWRTERLLLGRARWRGQCRPARYDAGDGLNWQLGVRSSYYFSRRLRFVATFNHERLNADAAHSPLVEQRAVRAYFGGFAYSF